MNLTSPVTSITGVGTIMAKKLAKLDIYTVFDLLYHLPFRYQDRRLISPAAAVQVGETLTIIGRISRVINVFTKNGKRLQTATVTDSSGTLPVIWFNQMYLSQVFSDGDQVTLYGKVDFFNRKPALISPEYEIGESSAGLVPIYPETAGLSSKWLRAKIQNVLTSLPDISPLHSAALHQVHLPYSPELVEPAKKNLAFDELFLLQLSALKHKQEWQSTQLSHPFTVDQEKVLQFIANLPFTLTSSQNQAIKEILSDLSETHPMNRLLEGDVGSGKTVVAAIAAYIAHLNGLQTLLLAPTQILASQHHQTLSSLFKPFGVDIGLVTSQFKISNLKFKILVGTHALLSDKLQLDKVGLVVIDEQHRFGVAQRALAAAKGDSPHILTMTATPIPRTVALTLYGDLDLSILDSVPGRIPVKTWVVPESKREAAYNWIKSQISNLKSQIFVVCPFIEESESLTTVKAAKAEFTKLEKIFSDSKLGLLHGKLKPKDKEQVIAKFRAGEYGILVATPVVEVGLDIPTATIMVIEGAERFGLAQLHQLRGRVGRSNVQSYCLLFSDIPSPRLKALETHHSGAELAEIDLKLRGAGDIYGTSQHGLTNFKIAKYEDFSLIPAARAAAEKLLPDLDKLPLLKELVEKDKIIPA
ncbi:MAG: ATP-dependent DNA helicase RecG [Candidatus Amesbacteria bacterium GW2011_GWB1_47_26]|uniref:Probable DNA 3'-5' helicase RecG n=1 Tax=Candidatus Amesbacteria bacterium GW2011_GWC2_45_19 TaxID=1618366 RepID=A0A0G1M530_9BACT|nr:MAG: ATP-dependent DNA helicase RecG [Candidatus Amesbacteria bacterium GW2011_GWC2_45_19]KKU38641.1 MAG: ATP-dependent DNA helicase RecG [Candidatus Amesbacteria bacterium GW2011_GWA1_46_35]KKU68655.1 MAG: ATP-dependent DNA helicase, ATP-dependent DNA helicase RecG [Microgenomates group bacterium GW2011_GWC1_47_20]KKU74961.1 MAG: ATP-dependent DNA helicase RecG [Candidatus Amesbacteria bacterium GW2011_GWB1_47_26]KKU80260.1 MAG: ATP-dependent DNA helicase RecG [Candidatus Amesbacteria bacte